MAVDGKETNATKRMKMYVSRLSHQSSVQHWQVAKVRAVQLPFHHVGLLCDIAYAAAIILNMLKENAVTCRLHGAVVKRAVGTLCVLKQINKIV